MLFNTLLLSLSVLGAATATASPSASVDTLAVRDIDALGPIPADAVPMAGGGFSFAAGSDAAAWVRAHNAAIDAGSGLTKRQNSGLSVTLWEQAGCEGSGAFFPNVQYGQQSVGSLFYYIAIEYRGRALLANEQLDLSISVGLGTNKCELFRKSLPRQNGPGCFNQPAFSCFRLLN